MPLLPFAPAPSKGGGSSPLTTKGDLFGFSSVNARLPVGTSGFPLQADSTQTLGLGYGTTTYNLNNQVLTNVNQILIGESATGNAIGGFEIATTGTVGITSKFSTVNFVDSPTFGSSHPMQTGSTPWGMNSGWNINSVAKSTVFYYMFDNQLINGSANLLGAYGTLLQPETDNYSGTITAFYGLMIAPKFYGLTGAAVTTNTLLSIGLIATGANTTITTTIGLEIGITNPLNGSGVTAATIWAVQIGNYNSFFNGKTTFGANGTPAQTIDVQSGNVNINSSGILFAQGKAGFGGSATPTWDIHVNGGNAATNAVGIDVSTVSPTVPGSSASGVFSFFKGASNNYYLLVTWNDGGTTVYFYTKLNGITNGTITWTKNTSLPA